MQPAYEQYKSGCQLISLLTNLEVQLFDSGGNSQLHYARYNLPDVLESLKKEALAHILQQPFEKGCVYEYRNSIQLVFLSAGIWDGSEYRGAIVVGPFTCKVYHPQLLSEMRQKGRLSHVMQSELQQYYNMLPMIDITKQQAISFLLINMFTTAMIQPQVIEINSSHPEDSTAVKFNGVQEREQDRELIEKRYEIENNVLHAITKGDSHLLKKAIEEMKGLSWPFRHPNALVRSMKNLSTSSNTLFRKAAENAGVHPLHLDSISGKFAIQIELAQSIDELEGLYAEMAQVYCSVVKELSVAELSPPIKGAVTYIRFNIDQPLSLNRIAGTLGVHPSYLSRAFKKELGITLTDYINKFRIEEAKYILDHGNVSVSETALSVGYNDPNYFSKVFTKLEHMTPHDYRKRKKGE
jgi:two-component system, response regulator YesN